MKTDIKDSFKLFKSYNGINAIQEKMNKIQKLNTQFICLIIIKSLKKIKTKL